jgi:hypothetical protein
MGFRTCNQNINIFLINNLLKKIKMYKTLIEKVKKAWNCMSWINLRISFYLNWPRLFVNSMSIQKCIH